MARWNDLSKPQVMIPLEGIIQFEEEVSKLCSAYGHCTATQKAAMKYTLAFIRRMKGMRTYIQLTKEEQDFTR